jgi:hypothetical protein
MMLTLPYYIEQFDAVRLLNDRGEVLNTLRTGQYYFDPIDISAPSGESTWQLSNYKGKEIVNAATLDAVFTKSGDESFEYEIVLPSRLAQQQIVQQTDEATVKDNTLKYHYEGRIAPEDFQNYEAITYDMIVIQKDKQGRAVSLVSNNVQLDKG